MLITIEGFRSIKKFQCKFERESITLISGNSGAGKSTVLNAIQWCLYGTIRNVRRFGSKSGKCMVGIQNDGMSINRSKSPESLQMEIDGHKYSDKEAQEKIDELYGSQTKWLSCCYLQQGNRNAFLNASPAERLHILNELCFHVSDPEFHIQKIDGELEKIKIQIETKKGILNREHQVFETSVKNFLQETGSPSIKNLLLDDHLKNEMQKTIETANQTELLFEKRYSDAIENNTKYETYHNQWLESVSKFSDYKNYILSSEQKSKLRCQIEERENIKIRKWEFENQVKDLLSKIHNNETLNKLIEEKQSLLSKVEMLDTSLFQPNIDFEFEKRNAERYNQYLEMKNGIDKLGSELDLSKVTRELDKLGILDSMQKQLEKYNDVLDQNIDPRDVPESEIIQASSFQLLEKERKSILRGMQMLESCTQDQIGKAIDKRKFILSIQPYVVQVSEIIRLENEVERIQNEISSLGKRKDWISNESDFIKMTMEIQNQSKVLSCPQCLSKLKIENDQLVPCSDGVNSEKRDYYNKLLNDSKIRIELKKQLDLIDKDLSAKTKSLEDSYEQRPDKTLEFEISELSSFPILSETELSNLYRELNQLERAVDSFHPYDDPEILKLKKRKFDAMKIKNEIESIVCEASMDQLLVERDKVLQHNSQIRFLNRQLEQYKDIQVPKYTIEECERQLEIKYNLSILSEINEMKKRIDPKATREKLEEIQLEIEKLSVVLEEGDKAVKLLEMGDKSEEILKIENKFNDIQIVNIDKIRVERAQFQEKIRKTINELGWSERATVFQRTKRELCSQRDEIIKLSNKESSLLKLKMLANELDHKRRITAIQTINDFTNQVLEMLFDDPIKIEFNVFRTLKTQKTVKPSIVYKILYKGNEVDSVDQLSGGEGDRVSLALSCAMFKFSKFPFLMLDESGASLDTNNKENLVNALKVYLGMFDKGNNQAPSILCISHDSVEGIYDHHIKI